MKDNFSSQSGNYARFRPSYPGEIFEYLGHLPGKTENAWDCGAGTGQIAGELAKWFDQVYATDISQAQLAQAPQLDNVSYSVQPAEKTHFKNQQFDLITVGQAIHWFDFDQFYAEVKRTARNRAILAVLGYGRIQVSPEIDLIITDFYTNVIGKYWDKERKYIDENYKTIPFPFDEIKTPEFSNTQDWTLDHLSGYLNTWSAVKHFIALNGLNPVNDLHKKIEPYWGQEKSRKIRFPVLSRIGHI